MTSIGKIQVRAGKWIGVLLFTCLLSLLTAKPAQADACVADRGGLIDGYVNPVPPSQIQIDGNCTIRNFPASNPLTSNISFYTAPGQNQLRWLVIFDNVVHTGQMACDKVQGHKIWFVNGSSSGVHEGCQNQFVPVEKITKLSPSPTASIGVPFTYKLIIPVLFDPLSGSVINSAGSPNDLHDITVTDDLNATGVDMTFVSEKAYWVNSGASIPHTFSNSGGALTFGGFPIVPAGTQFVIEVTVVLPETVNNTPGKQFINTAKWQFGRLIDGIFYEPLPGEWGISSPMTIAAPSLVVTKSGPATMNMGQWGNFGINIQNNGTSDAWNASISDRLPKISTGGMCDRTPEILSAQVFASDGVTPVPGKGPLTLGSDYSFNYSGAPGCQFDITILTAAGTIGSGQRLIIRYRTQLDSNTQNGAALTNVAGAVQWFNGDSSNANRKSFTHTLTDGTPGILDFQDAFTVTTALSGYFFDKTVADLTSNTDPATTAKPGDKLRYTLRFRTTGSPLNNFSIVDDMDALNTQADFAAGTLALVTVPTGADPSATSATGGSKGTGIIDIRNLNLPANGVALIQFDITLKSGLTNGTIVSNQATALNSGTPVALSDDPNVNGIADPNISGDEDPTRVKIVTTPALFRVQKISTDLTGDPNILLPGDKLRYTITVKNIGGADAVNAMLRDVIPTNTTYVAGSTTLNGAAIADVGGVSPLVAGTLINSPANATPGLMPADASSSTANVATITFDVTVNLNVAGGTAISNQGFVSATGIVDQPSDDPRTPAPNDPTINIVATLAGPTLVLTKSGPTTMNMGQWGDFSIDVHNTGATAAWNASIRDLLPHGSTGGMCDLTPEILGVQVFAADGVTAVPGKGPLNSGSDYILSYSAAPNCQLDMTMLTAAGSIGPNERLIIRYRTKLDANTQNGVALTNIAGALQWFDADSSNPNRKTSTGLLTNGTPGVADNQDAHTVTTAVTGYFFEKTVADLTSNANPATTAAPGDKLRYTLRFRTVNQALSNFSIVDDMDVLNAQADFVPGTLTLVTIPAGADTTATSATGGTKGTGVLDVRNLNVPNSGTVVVEFDITLKSPLTNGTVVSNQATLLLNGTTFAISDDPNVNGPADPNISGDEDPTRVKIASAAAFRVQKISTDMTGDPNVLLPGDKLRYTITVKNISTADAVNVMLRDTVPANTTYVSGSTTLNGAAVADFAPGVSPLTNGLLINSPANATPGLMPADASSSTANVATITFDVTVNPNVVAGTAISNQGFVSGTGVTDQPSDDPRTPAPNDPTINIVGSVAGPTLVVTKSGPATMNLGQFGTFGIDVQNTGPSDAWNASIRDVLPHIATGGMCDLTPEILGIQVFAADGVTPVTGKSPLALGSDYSLSYSAAPNCQLDITILTAVGTIGPNQRLIISYRTKLDANTQNGVALTNIAGAIQWFNSDSSNANRKTSTGVLTNGTPGVADNQDAHTVTTAVAAAAFRVQKISTDMTGDPNVLLPGDKLRYTITVKNISTADAVNVMLRDVIPTNTTYVAGSTTLNGAAVSDVAGTSPLVNGMLINSPANATPGLMPADASSSTANVATITFDVTVSPNVVAGTAISNQGFVSGTGITDQPSDDPRTPAPNDPTINIVGSVAGPTLVVTKSGPATMNLGQFGNFAIDVQNNGPSDAWNATIRDLLPHGTTGGMCNLTPEILSAQVFAADGVTPVSGKGALNAGSDYSLSYNAAPNCQLDITMLTAAGTIGPNQRLIIRYRTQLDAGTQNGLALTNIAGAIQWFDADSSNINRKTSTGTLTNGTPGVADYQDAHTVTVALSGYFFDKTVANLTSGVNPATTAVPGDKLRYTLRFRTTSALSNFSIVDEMDALNAQAAFAPSTLTLVATPAGADASATSSTGGTKGTGVIDIRNLNVPINGDISIQFDITLKSALANDTVVANQATLKLANGTVFALSDDPNVNGSADPNVSGDEDPTRVKIVSSAVFRVLKISTDLTGDPNVLLAGEKLRYTITMRNISNSDAVNVVLRDAVPANTTYVAGSTTLNGAAVADVAGASPLVNGMQINSPANATPGLMPADPSSSQASLATITFDVIVNPNTPDGTVISNQGVVSATGIVDQPSDDPRTPTLNDPTRDIVGNRPALPTLYAEKRVALFTDKSSPGIVDPGDVLRYTITIKNSAATPATGVVLKDAVPANTTYVANTTLLNGSPVGQPDGGVSPLASGISIGTIAPGATATLQYDLLVNAGTPAGTVISNQAVVSSTGQPNVLTDGDGNPATGPEPTVVTVGAGQQISITNEVSVVGGGAAIPGAQVEYVVKVTNTASVPAYNIVMTDDLNAPQPNQIGYVNLSATMNGLTTGVNFAGSTITGNYGATNGPLAPGAVVEYRFRATLNANLTAGTVVTNTAVAAWNDPTQTVSASVSITVGSVPPPNGLGSLSGSVWHDANFDEVHDSSERSLAGWTVELYKDNQLSQSVQTDANGAYSIAAIDPNSGTSVHYELRFHAPGAGANTAMLGRAASPFTNGLQRISDIIVSSNANLQGLNLPIHPNGVVYDSATRAPIVGATVTLMDARSASPLPAACFDDAAQQGQITLAYGYYKFDINFSDPACPSGGDYLIGVTAPAGANYVAGYSQMIPPKSNASTPAFSVPACPASAADAIPSTALFCEVQPSEFPPVASVPAGSVGTTYYVHLTLDSSQMPGTSQIFNNHIAIDPQVAGTLSLSKTTPALNVTRGQLVPYVITATNRTNLMATNVTIVDRLPAGFNYVAGSAFLDGVPAEPSIVGRTLNWTGVAVNGNQARTVKLLLLVGAGSNEGQYVNRAQAMNGVTGSAMSGEATAMVRLVPDVTFDCTDVTGKVFNDKNRNGHQDDGEEGLAGVRVVTPQGLQAMTDQYGRYHITCAVTPNEDRGSNFVLKLDDRTLPSGFRLTTDQVQIQRATRGKALRLNFGASIHRVVSIDLSDEAFEPGKTDIRVQWAPRINLLLEELGKAPAILRLSYVADTEDAGLVKRRVEAIKRQLTEKLGAADSTHVLTIEPEVFWRRGAPTKRPDVRVPGGK